MNHQELELDGIRNASTVYEMAAAIRKWAEAMEGANPGVMTAAEWVEALRNMTLTRGDPKPFWTSPVHHRRHR